MSERNEGYVIVSSESGALEGQEDTVS